MLLRNKTIEFAPMGVLTHEMMREIYAAPRRLLALTFDEYGDGIVTGLNFRQSNEGIILTRGIVKLRAEFFYLTTEINLTEMIKTTVDKTIVRQYHFILQPSTPTTTGGVNVNGVEIQIAPINVAGLMELGTFSNDVTAVNLPTLNGDSLSNCLTGSFNVIDVPYSFRGGDTFHPVIFNVIKAALNRKPNKHFFDQILISEIDNHAVASLNTIKNYCGACGIDCGDCDRLQLLKHFDVAIKKDIPMMTVAADTPKSSKKFFDDDESVFI